MALPYGIVVVAALTSLATSERPRSHRATPACRLCRENPAQETGGDGNGVCLRCADCSPDPYRRPTPPEGRNGPCPCGSGAKFKNCCRRK